MTTKAKQPLISVIIPVYNVEAYLDRCLRSVADNDYKTLQIICVNDGSMDASGEILEKWSVTDRRIQIITTNNRGVSEARNTGIREAKGQYICFIDPDDWVSRYYFSVLLSGLMNTGADISMCNHQRTSNSDTVDFCPESRERNWVTLEIKQYMNLHNRGYVLGKMYKRDLILPNFDPSMRRLGDIAYNTVLLYAHPDLKIAKTEEVLYYYFNRQGSLVNTTDGTESKRLFEYFRPSANESIEKNDYVRQDIIILQCAKWALSYRYLSMYVPSRKANVDQICSEAKNLLVSASGVPLKEKILYAVFLFIPFVYRLFRIMNDPTMINWEKSQKKKQKAGIFKND